MIIRDLRRKVISPQDLAVATLINPINCHHAIAFHTTIFAHVLSESVCYQVRVDYLVEPSTPAFKLSVQRLGCPEYLVLLDLDVAQLLLDAA